MAVRTWDAALLGLLVVSVLVARSCGGHRQESQHGGDSLLSGPDEERKSSLTFRHPSFQSAVFFGIRPGARGGASSSGLPASYYQELDSSFESGRPSRSRPSSLPVNDRTSTRLARPSSAFRLDNFDVRGESVSNEDGYVDGPRPLPFDRMAVREADNPPGPPQVGGHIDVQVYPRIKDVLVEEQLDEIISLDSTHSTPPQTTRKAAFSENKKSTVGDVLHRAYSYTDDTRGGPVALHHRADNLAPGKANGTKSALGDIYFVLIVAGCSAAAIFGVIAAGFFFYRLQKTTKAAADVDYPAYGVTGPNKEQSSPNGDRKLAQSAQMYHYQHQKQQMIAVEKASASRHTSASDVDSEEENEEGDYTVYECPGLASTGEMEVKNPLFHDDSTPGSPSITAKERTEK